MVIYISYNLSSHIGDYNQQRASRIFTMQNTENTFESGEYLTAYLQHKWIEHCASDTFVYFS